jgi:hypothetical protein
MAEVVSAIYRLAQAKRYMAETIYGRYLCNDRGALLRHYFVASARSFHAEF